MNVGPFQVNRLGNWVTARWPGAISAHAPV